MTRNQQVLQALGDLMAVAEMEGEAAKLPDNTGTFAHKLAKQASEANLAIAVGSGMASHSVFAQAALSQALAERPNSPELRQHLLIACSVLVQWAGQLDERLEAQGGH